jgi:hypothetical protein
MQDGCDVVVEVAVAEADQNCPVDVLAISRRRGS